MHPNPMFHTENTQRNLAFARERAFGILAVNADDGPHLSHIPFLLSDDGQMAELHLVRSNPIARALKAPMPCKIAISGPDSYISPDWYAVPDQVPTWNYVAVHLTGVLTLQPQDTMRDVLDRQTGFFEDQLLPKTPWLPKKMTPEVLEKMMRQIVPCRMEITGVDGTWKLGQNKPDAVRLRAADGVDGFGIGTNPRDVAAMMRGAK